MFPSMITVPRRLTKNRGKAPCILNVTSQYYSRILLRRPRVGLLRTVTCR
jgi:hypothetical protein